MEGEQSDLIVSFATIVVGDVKKGSSVLLACLLVCLFACLFVCLFVCLLVCLFGKQELDFLVGK